MTIQEYQEYTRCINIHTPLRDTYRVGSNPVEVRTRLRYRVSNEYYSFASIQHLFASEGNITDKLLVLQWAVHAASVTMANLVMEEIEQMALSSYT